MTEKQYHVQKIYKGMNDGVKIHDWCVMKNDEIILRVTTRLDCENIVDVLNKEYEELKSYIGEMEDYLARLEEKNEELKKILNELSYMLQFDVENGIRSYPVKLSEYLCNALNELQRND